MTGLRSRLAASPGVAGAATGGSGDISAARRAWRLTTRIYRVLPGTLYIVIAFLVVASLTNQYFATTRNFREILIECCVLGILACGTTLLLVAGLIDFAVGAELSLVTVVSGHLIASGHSTAVAIVAALATGIVLSMLQGMVVATFNVVPFIVSLGASTAYLGVALLWSNGIPESIGEHLTGLGLGLTWGIPHLVALMIAVVLVMYLLMRYTQFGTHIYALGGNERAAFLAGVRVRVLRLLAYTVAGVTVGIAGVALLARAGTASPTIGAGYELQALAAAVIGGTSFSGGRGTVIGTLIGVVLLVSINNLLALANVSGGVDDVVTGGIVVVAAIIDQVRSGRLRLSTTVS